MRKKQVKYRAIFLVFLLTLGEIHASNGYIKYNSFLTGLKRRSIKNNIEAPRTKREVSEIKDEVVEGTAVSESRKKRKYSVSIIYVMFSTHTTISTQLGFSLIARNRQGSLTAPCTNLSQWIAHGLALVISKCSIENYLGRPSQVKSRSAVVFCQEPFKNQNNGEEMSKIAICPTLMFAASCKRSRLQTFL